MLSTVLRVHSSYALAGMRLGRDRRDRRITGEEEAEARRWLDTGFYEFLSQVADELRALGGG